MYSLKTTTVFFPLEVGPLNPARGLGERCKLPSVWCILALKFDITAMDEKTRKVFSILVVISLVGTVFGKSLKLLPLDVKF